MDSIEETNFVKPDVVTVDPTGLPPHITPRLGVADDEQPPNNENSQNTSKSNSKPELEIPLGTIKSEANVQEMKSDSGKMKKKFRKATTMNDLTARHVADSQFLNTMKLNFAKEYPELPKYSVFPLLANGNADMLKKELIFRGPRELFCRDEEYRGLLQFALAVHLPTTGDMLGTLFDAFFELSAAKFAQDISELQYEKRSCLDAILMNQMELAASANATQMLGGRGAGAAAAALRQPQDPSEAVVRWFDDECRRVYKQALIRNEWFWIQMMSMEDLDGRTPLHYAIASNCTKSSLNILLNATKQAQSQLHAVYPKSRTFANLFEAADTLHDSMTGYAIVSSSPGGRKGGGRGGNAGLGCYDDDGSEGESAGGDSGDDEPDAEAAGEDEGEDGGDVDNNIRFSTEEINITKNKLRQGGKGKKSSSMSRTAQGKDDLSAAVGAVAGRQARHGASKVRLDFNIIIPWLLKNVFNLCQNRGAKFELTGVEVLSDLITDHNQKMGKVFRIIHHKQKAKSRRDEDDRRYRRSRQDDDDQRAHSEYDNILMLPEIVEILELLGIKVVDEVVTELCRRYIADEDDIVGRWKTVNKYRRIVWKKDMKVRARQRLRMQREVEEYLERGGAPASESKGGSARGRDGGSKGGADSDAKGGSRRLTAIDEGEYEDEGAEDEGVDDDYSDCGSDEDMFDASYDADELDDARVAPGKGSSKRGGSGGRGAKGGDDDGGDGQSKGSRNAGAMSSSTRSAVRKHVKLIQVKPLVLLNEEDKLFGLNVRHLLQDLRSGHAFMQDDAVESPTPERNTSSSVDEAEESATFSRKKGASAASMFGVDSMQLDEETRILGNFFLEALAPHHSAAMLTVAASRSNSLAKTRGGGKAPGSNTLKFAPFPRCVSRSQLEQLQYKVMNTQDSYGRTPLMLASALGYEGLLTILLNRCYGDSCIGSSSSASSPAGRGGGHSSVVDLSIMTPEGHTAISLACKHSITALLQQRLVGWLNEKKDASAGATSAGLGKTGGTSSKGAKSATSGELDNKTRAIMQLRPQLEQLQQSNWQNGRFPLSWAVLNALPEAVQYLLTMMKHSGGGMGSRSGSTSGSTSARSSTTNLSGSSRQNTGSGGGGIQEVDVMGRSAMHECMTLIGPAATDATAQAALTIAEMLYTAGADVNARSISGKVPLHDIFCCNGSEKRSESTVVGGNSVQDVLDVQRVNMFRRNTLRCMLQWGADPTICDYHGKSGGWSALHYASRSNSNAQCVLEMLRGCSVLKTTNAAGRTIGGYDVYSATKLGQNCLHIACLYGCDALAHILCRWDFDAEITHRVHYSNSLPGSFVDDEVASSKRSGSASLVPGVCSFLSTRDVNNKLPKHLLNHKTVTTKDLDTLWLASYMGNPNRVTAILNGMKIEYASNHNRGNGGRKGSAAASKSMDKEFWLETSVDCKSRCLKLTPMHCVVLGWVVSEAHNGGNQAARNLLGLKPVAAGSSTAGRSLNASGLPSRSAGGVAANSNNGRHAEVMQILLRNYAYVDAVDRYGRTPLMIACGANIKPAIHMLIEAMSASASSVSTSKSLQKRRSSGAASASASASASATPRGSSGDDESYEFDDDDEGGSALVSSLTMADIEGNTAAHFAYATGAAAAIVLVDTTLSRCGKRMFAPSNLVGDSPIDNAGKISRMLPVLPKRVPAEVANKKKSSKEGHKGHDSDDNDDGHGDYDDGEGRGHGKKNKHGDTSTTDAIAKINALLASNGTASSTAADGAAVAPASSKINFDEF